jgi:hypothetical protein
MYASRRRLGGVLFLAMENYGIFRLWVEVSDLSRALHNIPVHTTITVPVYIFGDSTTGLFMGLQVHSLFIEGLVSRRCNHSLPNSSFYSL